MHPMVQCVLMVLLAGFVCSWIRAIPAIEPAFKRYAIWMIGVFTAFAVLVRLGVVARVRDVLF